MTETTIQDEYDITLEATYQTQVPAPVILLEPLSINLPDMQAGEEIEGELTLTNYGLVRADKVQFTPPSSDAYYKYEFFGTIPTELEAKQRVRIPYRVTALQALPKGLRLKDSQTIKAGYAQTEVGKALAQALNETPKAGSCTSYGSSATVECYWTCAAGDELQSNAGSSFNRVTGASCGGGGGGGGGGWGGGGGNWGGGGGSPAPIPMTPGCTPNCSGKCCP